MQNLHAAIYMLCSDQGGKYLSTTFNMHLSNAGTSHCLTVHDTPQLNGIAKRLNCMLMKKVCALLHCSGLPQNLWKEALHHSTWLKNCTSTCVLGGKMPWEALHGHLPDLHGLKHFSEMVWVYNTSGSKLDPHTWEGHWSGFDIKSHRHHIYQTNQGIVAIEHNVHFSTGEHLKGEGVDIQSSSNSYETKAPTAPDADLNASDPDTLTKPAAPLPTISAPLPATLPCAPSTPMAPPPAS
jgi:hypothetical protein